MTVTEAVLQRRSVPSFDSVSQIETRELYHLIEMANLSPSSMNLQSWDFMVCQSPEDKARLRAVSYDQKKITEASAAVIILGNLNHHENAAKIADENVRQGILPAEKRDGFVESAHGAYKNDPQRQRDEAFRGGSLWAMSFMLLAQEAGWATAPMGGFIPADLIREFNLPAHLLPVMIVCIGKPNPEVTLYERAFRIPVADQLTQP
jgi:putative NAD(P)H nitroreductase